MASNAPRGIYRPNPGYFTVNRAITSRWEPDNHWLPSVGHERKERFIEPSYEGTAVMRFGLKYITPLLAAGPAAAAIAAAPTAAAAAANQQSCASSGSATQCQTPGDVQITAAPSAQPAGPSSPYFGSSYGPFFY